MLNFQRVLNLWLVEYVCQTFAETHLEIPGIALDIWKCPELFSQISARTYSCLFFLMLWLFILSVKTRIMLGPFIFRCFTFTVWSALIELQDVKKQQQTFDPFLGKVTFFIVFVTLFAGNKPLSSFVIALYFGILGFQAMAYIYNIYIYIIIYN